MNSAPLLEVQAVRRSFPTDKAAEQTLDAVVGWGRYAEAFAYDDRRQQFSLENPA